MESYIKKHFTEPEISISLFEKALNEGTINSSCLEDIEKYYEKYVKGIVDTYEARIIPDILQCKINLLEALVNIKASNDVNKWKNVRRANAKKIIELS